MVTNPNPNPNPNPDPNPDPNPTSDPDPNPNPNPNQAAAALGCRPLAERVATLLGDFKSRVRMHRWLSVGRARTRARARTLGWCALP